MKKKILIYFVIIFLILNIVIAQPMDNFCVDSNKKCDSDVSKIPPDNIDVSKVIANGRGKELTVAQIEANLDKINNLNDVDLERARTAIKQKYGVTVKNFGQSASLKQGVLQANFGKQGRATVTSETYKKGFLEISKEGEIVFFISTKETKELIIPNGDSIKVYFLDTVYGDIIYQGLAMRGVIKINPDGAVTVLKGEKAVIENVRVEAITNDVNICTSKQICSGNYVFLTKETLVAEGTGFSLTFFPKNTYFYVDADDLHQIYLGNGNKNGKVEIKFERPFISTIETDGFVRVVNNHNQVTFDGKEVKKELFKERLLVKLFGAKIEKGSVSSVLIADGDRTKVYILDENRNLHTYPWHEFTYMNEQRAKLNERGLAPSGYFSPFELDIFESELNIIENTFGIDFNKIGITITSGGPSLGLEIIERDRSLTFRGEAGLVDFKVPTGIYWSPDIDLSVSKPSRQNGFLSWTSPGEEFLYYRTIKGHEFGHVIDGLSAPYTVAERQNNPNLVLRTPLRDSIKNELEKASVKFDDLLDENKKYFVDYKPVSDPSDLFPSEYAKGRLAEYTAEIFATIAHNPKWFTDPYNGGMSEEAKIIKLSKPVSPTVMKQREALRDIWLKELKKYKKDNK